VLRFPAKYLPKLPLGFALHCEANGARFVFTTSKDAYQRALEERTPVFVGGELIAVAHAAQNDRLYAEHFAEVLERKRDPLGATVRVTARELLGAINVESLEPLRWTFGRVLEQIGARLVRVEG